MLLHLCSGKLPWDNIQVDYETPTPKSKSLFTLNVKINFHSESHSIFYNLKKNTNYKDFYKKINKYDKNIELLLEIYTKVIR
jgi:hypothetical protein